MTMDFPSQNNFKKILRFFVIFFHFLRHVWYNGEKPRCSPIGEEILRLRASPSAQDDT